MESETRTRIGEVTLNQISKGKKVRFVLYHHTAVYKGNASVVMGKLEYTEILSSLVENHNYSKVKKNSTLKTERKLSQILKKDMEYFALNK